MRCAPPRIKTARITSSCGAPRSGGFEHDFGLDEIDQLLAQGGAARRGLQLQTIWRIPTAAVSSHEGQACHGLQLQSLWRVPTAAVSAHTCSTGCSRLAHLAPAGVAAAAAGGTARLAAEHAAGRCEPRPTAAAPMDNTYCSCKLRSPYGQYLLQL